MRSRRGKGSEIPFKSFEVLPCDRFETVDSIERRIPTDCGDLVLEFDGQRAAETGQHR